MRDHRHPLDSGVVVSREIHIEGQFSDAEWFQMMTALVTLRRGMTQPPLPKGCVEAEVIPPALT